MELNSLQARSRKYTRTNSSNYTDEDLTEDINIANGEVHMMIIEAEGYKNVGGDFEAIDHESTTGLSEQELGYNGEYPFPTDSLRIEEAHIKYADADDYAKAEIINKSSVGSEMFNDNGVYSKQSPKIFVFRDSYFIRPLLTDATVTDGIKLLVTAAQESLVDGTDTPTFPANFHNIIPLKVAQDYYLINPDKYNPRIDKKVSELESQIISFYQDRMPIESQFKAVREVY